MTKKNFHTHSTFSDGRNTPRENVISAIEKGFTELGFSEHSYLPAAGYSMPLDKTATYIDEINSLRAEFSDKIKISCGLEFDIYTNPDDYTGFNFDYILGACHYVVRDGIFYSVDHSKADCEKAIREGFGGDELAFFKNYFDGLLKVIHLKNQGIAPLMYVAHFDLPTKFGVIDTLNPAYRSLALEVLDAFLDSDIAVEINTGAMAKGIKATPYPEDFLIQRVIERGGRMIFGSDCHFADKLDFGYDFFTKFLLTNHNI